ncbi:MAG: isoleucine--tRNA ligase [Erysipelothrix sp.]|nr:isoleucine--tRNA ligase [Erysipelothrix sp.]
MDYKDTLLMPKTQFEMRGNLNKKEPRFQKRWLDDDLYHQLLEKNKENPMFVLHDGPPYANGNIHIGHALNKILKDMVVRSHFMLGYNSPFTPGWDTHGLPIEMALTQSGVDRKSMSVAEFRKLCEAYALKQVDLQKADMIKLGTIADYDDPYITLLPEYEAQQIRVFAKMVQKGMVYKGLRPVYWSYSSESALAEAEIEYHDKKDMALYVAFKVMDGKGILDQDDKFVIWTTTPWTIPANLAIALNPTMVYARVKTEKGNLIVLKELVDELMETFKLDDYEIINEYLGRDLEMIIAEHPLYPGQSSLVILGDHVSGEAGTGCVHTAPGHGIEDFEVAKLYGIEAYCPVDSLGHMMAETGDWLAGLHVEDANKAVTVRLDELGALLAHHWIVHSYPHDWRTKKPVIFRATTQWFASIERIRDVLLAQIEAVHWIPSWGQLRMHNMIKDRGDWCISRQRAWGVPIPIFYDEDDQPIMDEVLFEHVATLFEKHGSNIWFEKEAHELLPEGYTHPGSPNHVFKKETDIMDVWFDSGSSWAGGLLNRKHHYPVDLYLEGSDQYRGWFNSSLIIATATTGGAPYKNVLSHGFVLDGKGEKMSKSMGNVIDPNQVTSTLGADILRLWTASVDYTADVRISDALLKQVVENYRKIRNTFRFMMGNLDGNAFKRADVLAVSELEKVDIHVLKQVEDILKLAQKAYREFDYNLLVSRVTTLLTNTLSAYYLDFTKDILYIEKRDALRRRQVQSVIYLALDGLVKALAPILVHTTEELWDHFNGDHSIHLETLVDGFDLDFNEKDAEAFQWLFALREDVFKALEEARAQKLIGKSLEAHVVITMNEADLQIVTDYINLERLAQWLIVSKAEVVIAAGDYHVDVKLMEGHTCPRCWNVTTSEHEDHLCDRCYHVLND